MSPSSPKAITLLMMLWAVMGLTQRAPRLLASGETAAQPLVSGISIHDGPGGAVVLEIAVTHPVPWETTQLSDPERLVLDLEGAREANLRSEYPAQSRLLGRVHTAQWKSDPAVFRIVADLKGNPTFSIKAVDSGIRIELKGRADAKGQGNGREAAHASSSGRAGEPGQETAQKNPPPESALQVHRLKDFSASRKASVLPPHERLVPVVDPHLTAPRRTVPAGPALVSGISIEPGSTGETMIDIASSRPVPYRVSQLANPFRLVIDLKDARIASGKKIYQVNSPVLKTVRIGQRSPDDAHAVRVVAELQGYPIFDVYAHQPGIRIALKPRHDPVVATRNPFKFKSAAQQPGAKRAVVPPHQAVPAGADLRSAMPGNRLANLAVIGLIEKDGVGRQAVISDESGVYLVAKGDIFENSFTVIEISTHAVEVQDSKTLETGWIAYSH
ncbi:MAG TPA: AMIN domain-containing protein [Terriglobia bacterium]|nr:AMIN domain-containing protein [Terriglobia bacterium]